MAADSILAGAPAIQTRSSAEIALREVSKWYGAVIGVNDVTLEIGPGVTGLLGPNGAGKSTLMKLITGQLRPSMGEVRVLGREVWRSPPARRRIGYVPEVDAFHEEMTAREFVRAMARLSGLSRSAARSRTEEVLARTGMADRAQKSMRACSKGMRQRTKLAQALVHDPAVLVLDEPLSGIDPPGRLELMDLFRSLRDEGKTLLVSTHILHEVEAITDRIVLMARGRILAAGALGQIREVIAEHPLTVKLSSTQRRSIGQLLLGRESVVGVSLGDDGTLRGPAGDGRDAGDLIVKVRKPDLFFRELPGHVLAAGADVERLETIDASVEAVFGYLVAGAGFEGAGFEGRGDRP